MSALVSHNFISTDTFDSLVLDRFKLRQSHANRATSPAIFHRFSLREISERYRNRR